MILVAPTHGPGHPASRVVAALTAFVHGGLAIGLAVLTLAVSGRPWMALGFFVFFGLSALASAVHAAPGIGARWPGLRVRPGSLKAVGAFFIAFLHWMIAAAAVVGVFYADTLWASVPMFFVTVLSLLTIAMLFAASGYFLYSLERVAPLDERG